jgi:hypothetical protein
MQARVTGGYLATWPGSASACCQCRLIHQDGLQSGRIKGLDADALDELIGGWLRPAGSNGC